MNIVFPITRGARLAVAVTLLVTMSGWPGFSAAAQSDGTSSSPDRVTSGLILLYDLESIDANSIHDRSGYEPAIDLKINDLMAVETRPHEIELTKKTLIKSRNVAARVAASIIRSGELTLEAWIQPSSLEQKGPARIFSYSRSANDRNFTIGQDGDKFDFRVRSTRSTNNGIPSLSSKPDAVTKNLTHLVYTRDRTGRTRIYLNGNLNVEERLTGDLTNWTANFHLAVGNEISKDRPWLGKVFLIAVYQRDLLPHEVRQNFAAGATTTAHPISSVQSKTDDSVFISKIAPLLSHHCLECHDSANLDGGLDLSSKTAFFAGGENGNVVQPGNAAESSIWKLVQSDKMPQDRPPLTASQKQDLKKWIDAGAHWTGGNIDPSLKSGRKTDGIFIRRLTVSEYIATVKSAVGVDIEKEAREFLPPDLRADGFNNTAYNLNVDLKHVQAYTQLAELIVNRMDVARFVGRFAKGRDFTDSNMRHVLSGMGKWLFRGPLEDHEFGTFLNIAEIVQNTGGDFEEATRFIIEAMLQSPRFIYQVENQRGDGSRWPVGDYELASRLSYIIWGTPPDRELMQAVDRGEFYDRTGVASQVERMLNDPRAIDRSVEFVSQWLNLDQLINLRPNPVNFPHWNAQLATDMRGETIEFFREVAWRQERPLSDLLNAQITFATPLLARHYQLNPEIIVARSEPSVDSKNESVHKKYDLSTTPSRGGLLTHASVLSIGGDDASMVTRGLFVLQDLLRGSVKDPPPCVDTTPVATKAGLTQRKIAEQRIADANCGGCHVKFEPFAFGLERFDGLGVYSEKDEHGNPLQDNGKVLLPGDRMPTPYASSAELMNVLANSDQVKENLTWKVAQFALGRPLGVEDAPLIQEIHKTAQRNGGTYRSLITAIVLSDLVQSIPTEKGQ